jgi:hypothetical protein
MIPDAIRAAQIVAQTVPTATRATDTGVLTVSNGDVNG